MNEKKASLRLGKFIRNNIVTNDIFFRIFNLIDAYIKKTKSPYHLTILKGYLIQMADDIPFEGDMLSLAKKYYQEAVIINPNLPEAYIELGYYYDVFEDDFIEAEYNFKKAIECGGQADAYIGLLRVLAEQGKVDEVRQMESNLSNEMRLSCKEILEEINNGIWIPESIRSDNT